MPRPTAGSQKRHGPHHQQNNQTGLVPPTPKRSIRSRSSSATTLASITSTAQTSVQEVDTAAAAEHPASNGHVVNGWDGKRSEQRYHDCTGEAMDGHYMDGSNGAAAEHRKIDINPSGKPSMDTVPSTVLSSFPLLDTITLLIIFLQLPSTVLTVIHFLFASLTFVPPSTTLLSASTASALPSFTNLLLQGSNGAPSLLTIIFADIVVAMLSMFLWPSARSFLIEFAQAVIAISLGAGTSSQNGGSLRNAAVCAGVMSGVKVVQGRFKFSDAWDSMNPAQAASEFSAQTLLSGKSGSSTSWMRNAIAVHIVAQGATRALRRWLIRRPEPGDVSSGTGSGSVKDSGVTIKQKDKDPEAAAGATPQPLERENSSAGSGGRRKKKNHIQQIRNHQPLWATVARTIVHVAKEVEQSQLSSEASDPEAGKSSSASNDSTLGAESGQAWLTRIGSTEVEFVVGLVLDGEVYDGNGAGDTSEKANLPFFVRVNGIVWPQTEASHLVDSPPLANSANEEPVNTMSFEWAVEITGLTGATEYDFEFVRNGGVVFYRTSACTMPAQASSSTPTHTPGKHPARPLSPITTLLHSLAQASSTLTETKTNYKAVKKAHKTGLSEMRKEIEKHRALLGNDRGDERAFRRNLALKESIKRAEEENETMTRELDELQSVPDKMKPQWQEKKKKWQHEKRRLEAAQNEAAEEKAEADRRANNVESDLASYGVKKEKLVARLTKLRADLEKLNSENAEGTDSKDKKQAEREAADQKREQLEKDFVGAISRLEHKISDFIARAQENWSTYYALENVALQQMAQLPPVASEAGFPSSSTNVANLSGLTFHNPHTTDLSASNRERSSSMFSDHSVLTNPSELEGGEFVPAFSKVRTNSFGHSSDPISWAMLGMERHSSE